MENTAMSDALEERIATALTSESVTSDDLAALLGEVDVSIAATELEHNKTLDPLASPDADSAWKAIEHATFMRNRLLTLRPRLEQRLQEVQAEEYLTHWRADYDVVKSKRDALAAELCELYPAPTTKIADLFSRMQAFDAELSRLHQARPSGVFMHLLGPELIARSLEGFTIYKPSLIDEVKLPAFEPGQPQAWPPPRKIDPAVFAPVPYNPRYSANWGVAREEQARAIREQREREAAEETARAAQRGEWWARGRV
jgi:hypothetical protein